jgi:hypothetical protein
MGTRQAVEETGAVTEGRVCAKRVEEATRPSTVSKG